MSIIVNLLFLFLFFKFFDFFCGIIECMDLGNLDRKLKFVVKDIYWDFFEV